jgi:hypothetical protein
MLFERKEATDRRWQRRVTYEHRLTSPFQPRKSPILCKGCYCLKLTRTSHPSTRSASTELSRTVVVPTSCGIPPCAAVHGGDGGNICGGREQQHFTGGAQRAACNSFRRPHAAQIRNNVGLVLLDSIFERSVARPTAQRVSGRRWHAMLHGTHLSLAVTSALYCTSSRQT